MVIISHKQSGKQKHLARTDKTGPIKRKRSSLPACRCCWCLWAAGASAGAGAFAVRAYNNAGVGAAGRAVSALTHLSREHACVQHKNTRPPLIQRWAHFSTRNVWRVQRFVVQQAISRVFGVKGGGGHACTLPLTRSLITDKASKQVMIVKVGASTNTLFDRQFSCSPRL